MKRKLFLALSLAAWLSSTSNADSWFLGYNWNSATGGDLQDASKWSLPPGYFPSGYGSKYFTIDASFTVTGSVFTDKVNFYAGHVTLDLGLYDNPPDIRANPFTPSNIRMIEANEFVVGGPQPSPNPATVTIRSGTIRAHIPYDDYWDPWKPGWNGDGSGEEFGDGEDYPPDGDNGYDEPGNSIMVFVGGSEPDQRGILNLTGHQTTILDSKVSILGGSVMRVTNGALVVVNKGLYVAPGGTLHIGVSEPVDLGHWEDSSNDPGFGSDRISGVHSASFYWSNQNHGLIRIVADADLTPNSYHIGLENITNFGDGRIEAIGGHFDGYGWFTVGELTDIVVGTAVQIDLHTTQRLRLADQMNREIMVALNSAALSTEDSSIIDFSAAPSEEAPLGFGAVVQAWDFTTNLAPGHSTLITMQVGPDLDPDLIAILHRSSGGQWTLIDKDFTYENGELSFYVDHFSSYAVTIVPEPAHIGILFGLGALLFRLWRKRTHHKS